MKKISCATLMFILLRGLAFSQEIHSVDLVTGTLNVNLPLFSISNGDVQVPGVLTYVGTGVRVTDDDGWIGHGWNFSADQFRISREMRGIPDDLLGTTPDTRVGWLHGNMGTSIKNFVVSDDNNVTTCADEVANYNTLNSFGLYQDTEPDVFYVSAPGTSFQFYFDENKEPRVVPYQDVLVTKVMEANKIKSFTVTDDKGVKYEFTDLEMITEAVYAVSPYYFVRKTNQHYQAFTYTTAWCLTKIISPVYGTVDLTYKTINFNNENLKPDFGRPTNIRSYRYQTVLSNGWQGGSTIKYSRSSVLKILDKISCLSTEAQFTSAPKFSGSVLERLNSIKIYDKRDGAPQLIKEYLLNYVLEATDKRAFLSSIKEKTVNNELVYSFGYNIQSYTPPTSGIGFPLPPLNPFTYPTFPMYSSPEMDEWEFNKKTNPGPTDPQYDETATIGALRHIRYPTKGYSVILYETHQYWDGTASIQGGGIRVKKIIDYDGVSSNHDKIQEFEYKTEGGNSSGKLTYKARKEFSVARQLALTINTIVRSTPRYRDIQQLYPTVPLADLNKMFKLSADRDIGTKELFHGSFVAYSRVVVKTVDAGYSVYEYNIPALEGENMANANEWTRSKVLIARPSSATCYERPNIPGGYDHYPFPPNPNYDFARGLLMKATDYREDGVKVRDVAYEYQNVYGGTAIRKVYGLALEELPTYYYNGSAYVDGKMFLFSKYEINTEVKSELKKTTETIYYTPDLLKKTTSTTDYFFTSANHRYLSRVETLNSDGTKSIVKYKYVKDYVITTPSGTEATAIFNLRAGRRFSSMIETTSSKLIAAQEKYLAADLTTYQTISGKVLPFKTFNFVSANGSTTFAPSLASATSFTFDQTNYVLDKTLLSFDAFGNATEVMSRDRDVTSIIFGYNGTLPVLNVSHARLTEMRYSSFDANGVSLGDAFLPSWSYTTCPGRNNSLGLNVPAGSATSNYFTGGLSGIRAPVTIFSFWAKATANATVYLKVGSTTLSVSVIPSTEWKYYNLKSAIESTLGYPASYPYTVWTTAAIQIDDMAIYPETVDFLSSTYKIPFGKSAETDSRGNSSSYEYDDLGRLKVVYDRDKNILKTYDYRVKPY